MGGLRDMISMVISHFAIPSPEFCTLELAQAEQVIGKGSERRFQQNLKTAFNPNSDRKEEVVHVFIS
jgi:hypothetical protein